MQNLEIFHLARYKKNWTRKNHLVQPGPTRVDTKTQWNKKNQFFLLETRKSMNNCRILKFEVNILMVLKTEANNNGVGGGGGGVAAAVAGFLVAQSFSPMK